MTDENVKIAMSHLIDEIRQSKTFREYEVQKETIMKQPELYAKVVEYREKNYELQETTPEEELFDKLEQFQKENEKLTELPIVDDFLRAEVALCRMLQELSLNVVEAVDIG